VFRYLKKTAELKLKFGNLIINIIKLINKTKGYTDNNFVKNINNKKFIIVEFKCLKEMRNIYIKSI